VPTLRGWRVNTPLSATWVVGKCFASYSTTTTELSFNSFSCCLHSQAHICQLITILTLILYTKIVIAVIRCIFAAKNSPKFVFWPWLCTAPADTSSLYVGHPPRCIYAALYLQGLR